MADWEFTREWGQGASRTIVDAAFSQASYTVTAVPELAKRSSSWQRAGHGGGDCRTSEPGGVVPGDWRPRGTERLPAVTGIRRLCFCLLLLLVLLQAHSLTFF